MENKSDNWVIVRVWLPKNGKGQFVTAHEASQDTSSTARIGHVSLQTKDTYASLWPDWEDAKKGGTFGALLGKAQGVLMPDPEADYLNEGKVAPDVIVVLYTLNIPKINAEFKKLYDSGTLKNWSLLGRNSFNVFNNGAGQSCSGLIYDLLNAGGIGNMVNWDTISRWWTVAPDAVARVVVEAARSKKEFSYRATKKPELPPGIKEYVTAPDYHLNPHENHTGYKMAQPSENTGGCIIS